ncbi:MAG: sortase [Candidatus Peribacteraceae bacterium]|nr:sortase [Candidatus Peribacteraceae bacterium]MDD5742460.1 sortase [Candidatus Peribacteraceae bacterium]
MIPHQKRSIAYVLAVLGIVLSLFLWAGIVRSLMTPVAEVTGGVPVPEGSELPSASSPPSHGSTEISAAEPERTIPLLPPLHSAGSAASRQADEKVAEMAQWEIREFATLSIPSLTIRSSVLLPSRRYWDARDWETLERQMQAGLLYGVVSYPNAVEPGRPGSIVIAGHSSPPNDRARQSRFGTIFSALPDIDLGAQILLRVGSETSAYTVVDTMVVPAGDTAILAQQKDESLLKLITCFPIGSTRDRYVVIAKNTVE